MNKINITYPKEAFQSFAFKLENKTTDNNIQCRKTEHYPTENNI